MITWFWVVQKINVHLLLSNFKLSWAPEWIDISLFKIVLLVYWEIIELVIISMRFSRNLSNLAYWSTWNAGIHSFIQIKETNTKKRITFQKEGNKRDGQKEAKLFVTTGTKFKRNLPRGWISSNNRFVLLKCTCNSTIVINT